jgi:uncharacterized protein (TIGR02284 family)
MTDQLNDLITTALDGVHGYKQAADHVKDPTLKTLFSDYAAQRNSYALELQQLVSTHGGTPTETGSVTAAFHRGWIGLKDALAGGDAAVVAECVRGEEYAKDQYVKALGGGDVPADAQTVLTRQHAEIDQALSHMKSLEIAKS